MIVLHDHKTIFLKSRKVGGTSFELALSKYAGDDCIITPVTDKDEKTRQSLGFRGPQNYHYSVAEFMRLPKRKIASSLFNRRWPFKFYNHIPAKEAKAFLGDEIWNSYEKVSIVRNPFDYAVSSYFWGLANQGGEQKFETWCLENFDIFLANNKQYQIDGEEIIDRYLRYDQLEQDILQLEADKPGLKGLWDTFRSISTKGHHRPAAATMDEMFREAPKVKALVSTIYEDEIERFAFAVPQL